MAGRTESQSEAILRHLRERGPLTPLEALNLYSTFRLAARVADLRRLGYGIHTEVIERNGKHVARYSLPTGQLSLFQTKGPAFTGPCNPSFVRTAETLAHTAQIVTRGL